MDKKRILIASFVCMVFLIGFVSSLTGSMGNARMVLRPDVEFLDTTTIEKYIKVNNVNDVPINITLLESSDKGDIIEIIEDSFVLEPGESKEARFDINLKWGGDYSEQINVLFSPMEGAGAGVALTSTVIIYANGMTKAKVATYLAGILVLILLILLAIKKRGHKNGEKKKR